MTDPNYGMKILENKSKIFWEEVFEKSKKEIPSESWLKDWQHLFAEIEQLSVLDIGCGSGADSLFLSSLSFQVVSIDFSFNALKKLKSSEKNIFPVLTDLNNPIPFKSEKFSIINASLSLHYFEYGKTKTILKNISSLLLPEGIFFSRFNSSNDLNHGAEGKSNLKSEIRENEKRFFDRNDLEELFADWKIIHFQEKRIEYYGKEKVVWEVISVIDNM